WTPSASGGFLRRLTGETGDLAVRGGYALAYSRNGLTDFQGQIANNPGVSINVFRTLAQGNLGALPLLMRDTGRMTPADFAKTPNYPFTDTVDGDITIFSPNLRVPRAETWAAGVTRAI